MSQADVYKILSRAKMPLTIQEISARAKIDEKKVSAALGKMLEFGEVDFTIKKLMSWKLKK
jgi:DNA-binding transcriptional regulator GbsR (MarR family)